MLAFHLFHYKVTFDPVYAVELLNHMWATEPVGTTSVFITLTGLILTLAFKLFDFCWDIHKERSRQGKLKIELSAVHSGQGQNVLSAVISNTGREPIVIRDIGYAKPRLFGQEFIPVAAVNSPLPHALNARDLLQLQVDAQEVNLEQLAAGFRVKDSLGKIWEASDGEIRKAKRLLKRPPARIRVEQPAVEEPTLA